MDKNLIRDMNSFLKELSLRNKKNKIKEVYLPRELFGTLVENMTKKTFSQTKKDLLLNITVKASDAEKIKYKV